MPIIILGGILIACVTPTEAAAVAVGYAFIIGFFVLRTLKLRDIPELLYQTGKTTGVVFLIIGSASIIGWILTMERVPEAVAAAFLTVRESAHCFAADSAPDARCRHVYGYCRGADHFRTDSAPDCRQ